MIVRNFSLQDISVRVNWINNPLINNTMYFELPASVEKTEHWYHTNQNSSNRKDVSFFNNEQLVAMGGLVSIDVMAHHAELYIMVDPTQHGQGWGKKATRWLLLFGFKHLNLNKIYLYTDEINAGGYSLYESVGMTYEGTMRQHKYKNGQLRDRRIYSMLAEEWEQLNSVEEFHYES